MTFWVLPELFRKRTRRTLEFSFFIGMIGLFCIPIGWAFQNGGWLGIGLFGLWCWINGVAFFHNNSYYTERTIRFEDEIYVLDKKGSILSQTKYEEINAIETKQVIISWNGDRGDFTKHRLIFAYKGNCTGLEQLDLRDCWYKRGYHVGLFDCPDCIIFVYDEEAFHFLQSAVESARH